MRNGGTALHILKTSALDGHEWAISFSGCFASRERAPPNTLKRRLGGPQRWSGCGGQEKIPATVNNHILVIWPVVQSLY